MNKYREMNEDDSTETESEYSKMTRHLQNFKTKSTRERRPGTFSV